MVDTTTYEGERPVYTFPAHRTSSVHRRIDLTYWVECTGAEWDAVISEREREILFIDGEWRLAKRVYP